MFVMWNFIILFIVLGIVAPLMIYFQVIKGSVIEDGIKEIFKALRKKNEKR